MSLKNYFSKLFGHRIVDGGKNSSVIGPGEQDWGFVDVRTWAHMFYWLFYTTAKVSTYTDRSYGHLVARCFRSVLRGLWDFLNVCFRSFFKKIFFLRSSRTRIPKKYSWKILVYASDVPWKNILLPRNIVSEGPHLSQY